MRTKHSRRTPGYFFAEEYVFDGPKAIGFTDTTDFADYFGYLWSARLTASGNVEIKQFDTDAMAWLVRPVNLPDFNFTDDDRRFSCVPNQAAQLTFSVEREGGGCSVFYYDVFLDQWQHVFFDGSDPVLFNDAVVNGYIGDSDVICFYVRDDLLRMRYQRDNFGVEETMTGITLPSGPILDRVAALFLKWQVRMSDAEGVPLELQPTSDLYPYFAKLSTLLGTVSMSAEQRDVVIQYVTNLVGITGGMSMSAALRDTVITYLVGLVAIEGGMSMSAAQRDVVTQYFVSNMPGIEGNMSMSALQDEIAEAYEVPLPMLEGGMTMRAAQVTI